MGKRITDDQIEIARSAFRNGRSIPECCSIANMSRASFNKYLGSEVQTWIDEHLKAKDRREQRERIDEIMPPVGKPIGTPEGEEDTPIIDSDDDFIRVIEYEFEQCTDYIEARDIFDHYRPQGIINLKRTEALRRLYESALNRKPKSKCQNVTLMSSPTPTDISQLLADQHRTTIQNFKSRFQLKKCPVPRRSTVADWTAERLYEHLFYWFEIQHSTNKEVLSKIKTMTLSDYKIWMEGLESLNSGTT